MAYAEKEKTMILNKNNFIDTINNFSKNDWLPLIDLIPNIEKVEKFGDDTKADYSGLKYATYSGAKGATHSGLKGAIESGSKGATLGLFSC